MQLNPWVTFVIAVLIAPTAEELLFRKLLTERIVKYGELAAVLASGLFFGLFHGNLNQFSYAFLLGLFLGFIYVKTGKLGYTIGLHMAINFIGSSLGTWMLRVPGYMDTMETLTNFLNTRNLTVLGDLGNGMVGMFIFGSYASLILMMAGAGLILMWLNRKKVCMLRTGRESCFLRQKESGGHDWKSRNLTVWRVLDWNHDLAVAAVKCLQEK